MSTANIPAKCLGNMVVLPNDELARAQRLAGCVQPEKCFAACWRTLAQPIPSYMPKTRTRKLPGTTLLRAWLPGGGGSRSDNGRNIFFVLRSSAMLRAPLAVFTVLDSP